MHLRRLILLLPPLAVVLLSCSRPAVGDCVCFLSTCRLFLNWKVAFFNKPLACHFDARATVIAIVKIASVRVPSPSASEFLGPAHPFAKRSYTSRTESSSITCRSP